MDFSKIPVGINLNIDHDIVDIDGMSISPDEAVDNLINYSEGFVKRVESAKFANKKEYNNFLDSIREEFGEIKEYNYLDGGSGVIRLQNPRIRVYVAINSGEDEVNASWYCKNDDDLIITWNIYKENTTSDSNLTRIEKHEFYLDGGRIFCNNKEISKKNIESISKLYYPYIDIDLMFEQFFTGQENILLLVGESGLGKSKLASLALKYAFKNPDKVIDNLSKNEDNFIHVAYVKSVDVLTRDSFWSDLGSGEYNYSLVIIDDLDYMLTKRDAEVITEDDSKKNAFLNQFLSFTDGIVKNKTKFIITTNQPYENIDKALLRKGRLFDILELRKLLKSEAIEIWKENNLDEKEFNEIYKDSTSILSADIGSEISKRLNKKITKARATMTYLKESEISKLYNAKRTKKIGL